MKINSIFFYKPIILVLLLMTAIAAQAVGPQLAIDDDIILLDGQETKIIGLRCSNALINDKTADELIAALDMFQSYGINTVSVFLMGSRFGDVKGYMPDSSLNPVYQKRFERILDETAARNMVTIVGCLYWSTSKAKEDLNHWTQGDANKALANTAKWLAEKDYKHVILDPDNEGMAVRANDWKAEELIDAAKKAHPNLIVANNTKQNPPNEDLNMHFGEPEEGKPWFDSEATPNETPWGYWGRYSKETHQADSDYYNYSRIGRYTEEMKQNHLNQTKNEIDEFNGYVFASTWLQCAPTEDVGGPFTNPGGHSNLGSNDNTDAAWNQDIDTIHPDAGIKWWLEFVKDNYAFETSH